MTDDIQLPGDREFVKVVQLLIDGRPVMRVGSSYRRHSQILEDALREFRLPLQLAPIRGQSVTAPYGDRYQAVGMCYCNRFGNRLIFNGDSSDYRIEINREHLEQCKPLVPKGIELEVIES